MIRVLIIVPIVYISTVADSLSVILELNSAIPATFMQLILPNIMLLKLKDEMERRNSNGFPISFVEVQQAKVILVLSVIMMAWGTQDVIKSVFF